MNEHVPSPVVPEPSVYTNHDNREEIPDNEEKQSVRIEVFPLGNCKVRRVIRQNVLRRCLATIDIAGVQIRALRISDGIGDISLAKVHKLDLIKLSLSLSLSLSFEKVLIR
jgi:hypothetical protein